ncbi:MAG: B12-binding domain-containing radical SAM protein [Sandaracinaceae bacterium]|nr:B12-binding domain-containing radical SAM protein [Sandaracinaceae bacterium]
MKPSTAKRLLVVAPSPDEARARLAEVGRAIGIEVVTPDAMPPTIDADAVWVDEALADALPAALLDHPRVVVDGLGMGSLALGGLRGRMDAEALGPVRRIAVRRPGGRRVRPAASKRTPFDADGRAQWRLEPADRARVEALAAPLWRVIETVWPGSAEALAVTQLIGGDAPRLEARATVRGVAVEVEVDEEVRGDEAWEVEASCARGTLTARFDAGRGVLLVQAPLKKAESIVDALPAELALARHALASPPRVGDVATLTRARAGLRAALDAAPGRLAARPISVALVHVPRYRNRYDELMLPSLGIARLGAFMRGYGFETRVADLEALHAGLDLAVFTDDARVDAWLAGDADPIIDARLEAMWPALDEAISERCLVGFSIVDYFGHFQMNLASCLARLVKDRRGQPTVLGGERDQVDGDRALRAGMPFDHVVDGDGEEALLSLACAHADADRSARDVPGVWTRDGDAIVRNRIVRSHLNAMPRPRFDTVPLERYRRAPSAALMEALRADGITPPSPPEPFLYLPYAFVKGCTADCTFCSAKEHLDVQAPEKTVDELLALREAHGVGDFVFLNNLVNLGAKWLRRFCERLVEAKADLFWTDSCRPTGIDPDLAHLMADAGCLLLNFGAESGSDAVLERMKKGLTRADIVRTLNATHAAGILNRVNLIAGYFHETPADVDLTISLVDELAHAIDVIGCFQGFYLFPGMGVDPEVEGITLRGGVDRLKTGQVTLPYDEIGGLPWEAKRESIDASRNRILDAIGRHEIRTIDKIDEYDLFWLARTFRDRARLARYVLRVPPAEASRPNQAALMPGGATGRVG